MCVFSSHLCLSEDNILFTEPLRSFCEGQIKKREKGSGVYVYLMVFFFFMFLFQKLHFINSNTKSHCAFMNQASQTLNLFNSFCLSLFSACTFYNTSFLRCCHMAAIHYLSKICTSVYFGRQKHLGKERKRNCSHRFNF